MEREEIYEEKISSLRRFKLENFEGPLDLLLKLIKDGKNYLEEIVISPERKNELGKN